MRKIRTIWVTTSCVVGEHQRGHPKMNVWCGLYSHRFGPFFFFLCWEECQVNVSNVSSLYSLRNSSGQYCLKTRIAAAIPIVWSDVATGVETLNIVQMYCLMRNEWCVCWMCLKLHLVSQMTLTMSMHPVYTFGCHFRDSLCSSHRPYNSYVWPLLILMPLIFSTNKGGWK